MVLIEARNLRKVYASEGIETVALHNATLTINAGEFVAITGPSGSGKSTLLHILGFLDKQTSGEYRFKGESFSAYSEDELAHIRNKEMGFVFQSFNLLGRTSVLENVMLPLQYSSIPEQQWEERAREVIEAVGLMHRLHHTPAKLSGGERQRVAIARALVMNPSVIFADEPTGNLDTVSGESIIRIFQKLHKEGSTIVLVTHEQFIASQAERIIEIRDGVTVADTKTQPAKSTL